MLQKLNVPICLVDDDMMCLNLYRQFVKQLGYTNVEIFDNGYDCLDSLEKLQPAIIFLDYNMEEMNGIDVLKKIRAINPKIVVVFISGQEDVEVAVNAMRQGAVDYIVKSSLNTERMKEIMEKLEPLVPDTTVAKTKGSFLKRVFS
jgi:DNA-binding NtrC family response regulator